MTHLHHRLRSISAAVALAVPALGLLHGNAQASCAAGAPSRLGGLYNNPPAGIPYVVVLAHRGLWGKYNSSAANVPENSSGSVNAANNACLDGMELDVKMTQDGVPVLSHDYNLGRTTNIWQITGGTKYNPSANTGTNPTVSSLTAQTVTNLLLLTPDRNTITGYYMPSVDRIVTTWINSSNQIPIVFDVKTASHARALDSIVGSRVQSPRSSFAMKVNVTTYQSRANFDADVPNLRPIPVFVTNNLNDFGDANGVAQRRDAWATSIEKWAIEANVKSKGGFLQGTLLDWAHSNKVAVGVFNAIPDGPSSGQFYDNDGHCCYKLSDKYITWNGQKETADNRGDWNYINDQGFTFVTTDDPKGLGSFLAGKGKH